MRGVQASVVYNFFPNAAPGQKILEAPNNLIYLPVTVDVISTLSAWLTDQRGKSLDLRERNWLYVQYKVNVSENLVDTLRDAILVKKGVTLCFPKGGIRGDHVLLLTPPQISRLNRAQAEGRRVQIRMSTRQVAKNVSCTGGFLGMLTSHATRALPTLLTGLAMGLLSGGISKAISGSVKVMVSILLPIHLWSTVMDCS